MGLKIKKRSNFASLLILTILMFSTSVAPLVLANNPNSYFSEKPEISSETSTALDSHLAIQKLYSDYQNNRQRPENVIDSHLEEMLENAGSFDELEIIIQFMEIPREFDFQLLSSLGVEVVHQFSELPAVFAKGTKDAVLDLAESDRIFWMEYNEPLDFNMDLSLRVVNATKTWNSIVTDEENRERKPIDGAGVTVVVLDTGIDAGHPDLDYKEKTISNLKSDFGFGPWVEMENSDTSYGHGTHCAGTVAGNGHASGGARRGVAPGANLIGLSIGDFGVNLANALGGYEWLYANSKPYTGDPGDHNIRVVSNSWGPSADKFDPTDAISLMIEKCTVDKNVVSLFAAGNSGENNHDGHTVETNPYGSTPMSISVAATERNGKGMAYFSSRGEAGLNETWPDVAAPGVGIWSAAARRTYISVMKNAQDWADLDPYYFAISGTSMATPHVAGAVALLFQACPSLKLSYQHDDFSGQDTDTYSSLGTDWWSSPTTLVHEAELILEASTGYIKPEGDNGVPNNNTIGWTGTQTDFAQGYGLMNVQDAVAIALTLNELRTRDFDGDGKLDYPNASVYDAIEQYSSIIEVKNISTDSDKLISNWEGDWTRFTNQTTYPNQMLSTDQSHFIYVPEEASKMILDLNYEPIQSSGQLIAVAKIRLVIDYDGDGAPDWPESTTYSNTHSEIDLNSGGFASNKDKQWTFNIEGVGFGIPDAPSGNLIGESYYEITVEYTADLRLIFDSSPQEPINANFSHFDPNNPKTGTLKFGGPTSSYSNQELNIYQLFFNLGNVRSLEPYEPPGEAAKPQTPWYVWLLLAVAFMILAGLFYRKYKKQLEKQRKKKKE